MLIIVRHGRTAANAEGRLLGRDDPALDDIGVGQAWVARALVGPLGAGARVVCSPLLRAATTGAIIASGQTPVVTDERWREIDYGDFEGSRPDALPEAFWRSWRDDPSLAPPGGESLRSVAARVAPACEELLAEAASNDVVVVSHVSPIKAAVAWALGTSEASVWRMTVAPGSVSRVVAGPHGPVLVSFNETG
ncbi:MAG: histidine phosphatase family protein [Acidimicrobiia bacterium]